MHAAEGGGEGEGATDTEITEEVLDRGWMPLATDCPIEIGVARFIRYS